MYFKTPAGKKAIKLMLNSNLERLAYKKPQIGFWFEDGEDK